MFKQSYTEVVGSNGYTLNMMDYRPMLFESYLEAISWIEEKKHSLIYDKNMMEFKIIVGTKYNKS